MAEISAMSLAELETILEWAATEGWNPGIDDAATFLQADPRGFLVKRIDGTPVSAISVVNHAPNFAFLGLYLCHPDFRGQGHGWDIWQAGIAHAGDRTIGLDGVPAQQENYAKSGFNWSGKTIRFTGNYRKEPVSTRSLRHDDLDQILLDDRRFTGVDRSRYLRPWLRGAETRKTRVVVQDGKLSAFATVRDCRNGAKIGPLRATTIDQAMDLVGACSDGNTVSVDVPDSSPELARALVQAGFEASFETARMYRGPVPGRELCEIEAVATLELG